MAITAKELAKQLNLSTAAVSMALNGKPGVSTRTRKMVLEAAHANGYDFSKLSQRRRKSGTIYLVMYRKHGAVVGSTEFFETLILGARDACSDIGISLRIIYMEASDILTEAPDGIFRSDCIGIVLLGTEMKENDFLLFQNLNYPIVVLDSYSESKKMDFVTMNNVEGAYEATRYLIRKRQIRPGYLHSKYPIYNFSKRMEGYFKALHDSSYSSSDAVIHELTPSMEGAYYDMLKIIESSDTLAECYFADNDLIAAGAMKAFQDKGFSLPDEIGIVGFDNVPLCTYIHPQLTTINVPVKYMARTAIGRLLYRVESQNYYPVLIMVGTNLIERKSG